jgi:hypothetical protein
MLISLICLLGGHAVSDRFFLQSQVLAPTSQAMGEALFSGQVEMVQLLLGCLAPEASSRAVIDSAVCHRV